jgi:hypothetical protein
MSDTSNDEEPHYTSPPSPVVRNLKCVDAESYKTAEALLDDLLELAKERDEIRKQRDEARQEVCVAYCDRIGVILCGDTTPQDYAKQRGWDCFDNLSEIS